MAIKYPTKDGKVVLEGERDHTSIRGASSGFASSNDSSHALAVGYVYDMARRSYSIYRSFFCFDTSDITSTISSATFGVRGSTNSSADTIIVKSDAFGGDCGTTLANGDYNNLDFTTPYSSERTSWNTNSSYNDFTLNSTALLDVKNNNSFTLALIEHDYDYSNVDGRGYQVKNGHRQNTFAAIFRHIFPKVLKHTKLFFENIEFLFKSAANYTRFRHS